MKQSNNMESKIPKEVIKELDINDDKSNKEEFEVTAIVESHQVKLPILKKLMNQNTAYNYLVRMYNRGWLSKKRKYWKARR